MTVVIGFALGACSSHDTAVAVVTSAKPEPQVRDAGSASKIVDADAGCSKIIGTQIENGACSTSADCVLTDLANECDACNLEKPYVALKAAFDRRQTRCSSVSCALGCPPHDEYIPAFYRPECRNRRCIAWRYHGGG